MKRRLSLCLSVCLSCLPVFLSASLSLSPSPPIPSLFSSVTASFPAATHPPAEGTLQESSAKDMPLNKHPKPAISHENMPAGPAISWQMRPDMTKTPLREAEGGRGGDWSGYEFGVETWELVRQAVCCNALAGERHQLFMQLAMIGPNMVHG